MVNLDYFYGSEGEQYRFYQIPAVLLEDDEYKKISDTAKILYGILLSRLAMSKKNNWIDFNCGELVKEKSVEELSQRLYEYVLKVASGEKVKAEEAGFHDMAIFKQGVTL